MGPFEFLEYFGRLDGIPRLRVGNGEHELKHVFLGLQRQRLLEVIHGSRKSLLRAEGVCQGVIPQREIGVDLGRPLEFSDGLVQISLVLERKPQRVMRHDKTRRLFEDDPQLISRPPGLTLLKQDQCEAVPGVSSLGIKLKSCPK